MEKIIFFCYFTIIIIGSFFKKRDKYVTLKIISLDPNTKIWVGDDEGNYVCSKKGILVERLLRGNYEYSFSLKGERKPIKLYKDMEIFE